MQSTQQCATRQVIRGKYPYHILKPAIDLRHQWPVRLTGVYYYCLSTCYLICKHACLTTDAHVTQHTVAMKYCHVKS